MTITPDYVDSNWCPDCGLPRGVCDCEEYRTTHDLLYPDEHYWIYGYYHEDDDDDTADE